jgi:hypothetical protein
MGNIPEPERIYDAELVDPPRTIAAERIVENLDRYLNPGLKQNGGELVVMPDGAIETRPSLGAPARRISALTQETFASPNLDEIARQIRESQQAGVADPNDPARQLWVDHNGDIHMGHVDGDNSRLSKLTQETFASIPPDHLERDRQFTTYKMPGGTQYASDGEYDGWSYRIVNEFGDVYDLFLWFNPATRHYNVSLVSPRMEGTVDGHGCHLYSDGTLCLREGVNGYPEIEQAYARSVLWTSGASCYQRGYGFQFNLGQDG